MPYPRFYRDVVILGIIIFLFWKIIKKEYTLLDAVAFALPFKYAYVDIGFAILLSQGLMTLFVLWVIIKKVLVRPSKFVVVIPLLIFLIYGVLDTLLVTHINDIKAIKVRVGSSYFREEGRYLLQIFVFIYFYLQVFAVKNFITSNRQIVQVLRTYLLAIFLVAFLGFIQFLVFRATGMDIFPMDREAGGAVRSSVLETLGQSFARVTSLGGEPKGLGSTMALGFATMVILNRYEILKSKYYYLNFALYLFIIAMTFSTGAYLLLGIFLIGYPLILIFRLKKPFISTKKNLAIAAFVILGVVVSFQSIYTVLELRIFTKLSRNTSSEASDLAIYDFFQDHPEWIYFGSGLGNIHNLAMEYTPERHRQYMYNNVWVGRTGFLRIISELGVIGFLLFLFVVFSAFLNLGLFFNKDQLGNGLALVLLFGLLFFFSRGPYLENQFLLLLSLAFAYKKKQPLNVEARTA